MCIVDVAVTYADRANRVGRGGRKASIKPIKTCVPCGSRRAPVLRGAHSWGQQRHCHTKVRQVATKFIFFSIPISNLRLKVSY